MNLNSLNNTNLQYLLTNRCSTLKEMSKYALQIVNDNTVTYKPTAQEYELLKEVINENDFLQLVKYYGIMMPVRLCITGQKEGLPLESLVEAIGIRECIIRVKKSISLYESVSQ